MSRWMRVGGAVALATGMTMAVPAWAGPPDPGAQSEAFFETKVRPLLSASCLKCHGEQKQSAGLRLDSREAMVAGGDSGPALEPSWSSPPVTVGAAWAGAASSRPCRCGSGALSGAPSTGSATRAWTSR